MTEVRAAEGEPTMPCCQGCQRPLEDIVEKVETTGRAYRWDGECFEVLETDGHRDEEIINYQCSWCALPLNETELAWFRTQPTDEESGGDADEDEEESEDP